MKSGSFTVELGARFSFRARGEAEGDPFLVAIRKMDGDETLARLEKISSKVFAPVEWDLSMHAGARAYLEVHAGACEITECCLYGESVLETGAVFFIVAGENISIIKKETLHAHYAADAYRPLFHFTPVMNWINDPCGLIQWKGLYHLFYQYHPYSSFWGPMHWGHAVSADMVRWRHLPLALAPDEPGHADDFSGIFTGSAMTEGDSLALVYTDHRDTRYHPGRMMQSQALASGTDGVRFKKFPGNPVLADRPEKCTEDFRDPKVWREGGEWRMVLGTSREGRGEVLLYTSSDLKEWDYRGVLYRAERDGIGMFECPDFFMLDGRQVLLVSVVEEKDGKKEFYTTCITGSLRDGGFIPGHGGRFDFGPDCYAPQTFADEKGRRIAIAWMENWGNQFLTHPRGWTGAMTLPRELSLDADGGLIVRPVKELETLRKTGAPIIEFVDKGMDTSVLPLHDNLDLFELILECSAGEENAQCGIVIAGAGGGEAAVIYDAKKSAVVIDRNGLEAGEKGLFEAAVSPGKDGVMHMHVYCDRSSLEVFAGNYRAAGTARVYFGDPGRRVALFSRGRATVKRCMLWELSSAW